jgi:hypothetical protein
MVNLADLGGPQFKPNEPGPEGNRNVHDDYVDSLAIACAMSLNDTVETVEESEAPWFARR